MCDLRQRDVFEAKIHYCVHLFVLHAARSVQ